MTNGKRNRAAGHAWEREGVKSFASFYPEVQTSRACNRARDAEKVDLAFPDESRLGRFPYNAQYKSYSKIIPYYKYLSEMPSTPGVINVIMHRQTSKSGSKFMTRGKYAIMNYEDFFQFVQWRRGYEILRELVDLYGFPNKEETLERLKQIGL